MHLRIERMSMQEAPALPGMPTPHTHDTFPFFLSRTSSMAPRIVDVFIAADSMGISSG